MFERAAAQRPRDVVDRLRLAVLALDSDNPQPVADVVAAAADALRLGDLALSERLGAAVLERDPDLDARLTLAQALAWQGRGREADDVLAAVDPAGLSDTELMAWALPRAANQFWMLSEPERATAFLQTTRNRASSPVARTTVDALSATFAMNAGRPGRAMEIAEEVLASPNADDTAVGWSAAAAALSSARMGRFADVDALAERAMEAQHPGLLRFTSGFGQTTMLLMAGELDRAQELAQQLTDFAQMQQPGRAIGEILVADVLISRGEFAAAAKLLRGAAEALAPTGYSWGPLAWMLLAQALGSSKRRPRRQRSCPAPILGTPNRRAGEGRVEDEVRPRSEQVGRQRDHDEPRTALAAQVALVCQQRLMIYQLVESQVHRQGFHACRATRLKRCRRACRHRVQRETVTTRRRRGTCG